MRRVDRSRFVEPRSGIAVPVVVAVLAVIGALVILVSRYQASRIKATGEHVSSYSALEAAQAGLHLALAEMRATPGWATHRLELEPATGAMRWADALTRRLKSQGDPSGTGLLKVDRGDSGCLSGTIGSGVFTAKFKVKAGKLPLADDPNTRAIDESSRFARVEVVALKSERGKVMPRATRLDVLVERVNFTEYVLYDGEDIVIGMGAPTDRENTNVIADGWLFGRNYVHLGVMRPDGTRLSLANMGKVLSDGPIRVWDQFDVTFQDPRGLKAVLSPANDSSAGPNMETAGGNILDGNHRKSAGFPTLDEAYYRKLAKDGGVDVSGRPAREDRLALFPEGAKVHLDFGHAGYTDAAGKPTAGLAPDDAKALGRDYPKDFNGLIFCDKPLAVWGSPDRDVTIFCTKDIYVCGDLNARTRWRKLADGRMDWVGHRENYKPRFQPPRLPPVEGTRHFEYVDQDREVFTEQDDPGQRVRDGTEERVALGLLSLGRIWLDARRPSRFLANELRPYIKFKIVEALSDAVQAYEWVKDDGRPQPVTDVALKYRGVLGASLQELFDIRRKVTSKDPLTRLYLTPESYDRVTRAFQESLVQKAATADERGVLTREKLEGTPGSPGLVEQVLEALTADEDRAAEFRPDPAQPPDLGIWNAPQALYNMVYDERGVMGPRGYGAYSDWGGDPARAEFQRDELFMPQHTVNAMLISCAARNDPGRSPNPTSQVRRFEQLGNGAKGVRYLSPQNFLAGNTNMVTSPFVLRVLGSQVRLATRPNTRPALEVDWYYPPIRRFIYDPSLPFHPPPHLPWQLELVSFKQRGAVPDELASFDR